jgi:SnoaL-like polyketide cyclase
MHLAFGLATFDAFPDLVRPIEDLFAEGDRVVARCTSAGTHAGAFQGRHGASGDSKDGAQGRDDVIELWNAFAKTGNGAPRIAVGEGSGGWCEALRA